MVIKHYKIKLNKIINNNTTSMKYIANCLKNAQIEERLIKSASSFADDIGVSKSNISKFTKLMKYDNFSEIIFLNNHVWKVWDHAPDAKSNELDKAAELINKSRKILFLGVSNSYISNEDFSLKLQRMDKWVVSPPSKYDQAGMSKILTSQDLIIINSATLQHEWINHIIESSPARKVVITNNKNIKFNANARCTFLYYGNKDAYNNSGPYTEGSRVDSLKIFDQLFKKLIKIPENRYMLANSMYIKIK